MRILTSKSELATADRHYWRIARFEELGFRRHQAEMLELAEVDWHQAQALLERGCSLELVLEILT